MIQLTTDWNYNRIKQGVKKENWPLLKALIRMRTLNGYFKLSDIRMKYPSLFNEDTLVGRMHYGLSPQFDPQAT